MRCPLCRANVPPSAVTCPNCGKNVAVCEHEVDPPPEGSRKLAIIACATATPAWLCGLWYLLLLVASMQSGGLHRLAAGAGLLAALGALAAALARLDALGRLQIAGCVAVWVALLSVIAPSFGMMSFLLLVPLAGLAALALVMGLAAGLQHWRDGWPARSMALLACAGLPLLLGSLCLMGSEHAAHDARIAAPPKAARKTPREQKRFHPHLERTHHIELPQKSFCVVAPKGGSVPTPEGAAGMGVLIAAEHLERGTQLLGRAVVENRLCVSVWCASSPPPASRWCPA